MKYVSHPSPPPPHWAAVDSTSVSAGHAVQGAASNADDLLALQSRHSAWTPHVVISAMAQAMVVSFAPVHTQTLQNVLL